MAARKTPLRAVKAGETAARNRTTTRARKKTVAQAAATGTHRDLLVAMRDRIAKTVVKEDCPPRDLASLTRRLQDIAKEIETIDLRAKEEALDGDGAPEDEAWDQEAL